MTAITFPTDPANGSLYTAPNGCVYIWDGEKWMVNSTTYTGTALTEITQDRVHSMFTHGENVGISFSYNDSTDKLIATVSGGGSGDSLVNGDSSFSMSSDGTLTLTHPAEPALHPLATVLTVQKAAGNYHTISGAYGLSLQATPVPSGSGLNTNTNFVDIFHDGISVNVNNNTWAFGTDGNLTLPNGGKLGNPYGDGAVNLSGNQNLYAGLASYDTKSWAGVVDATYGPGSGIPAGGGFFIQTNVNVDTKIWAFKTDGGLVFPDATTQTTAYTGGGSTSYTPDDTDNWNEPAVNTISAALDELAARVTAFENFEIDGGNAYTPALGELLIDGNGA